MGSAMVVGPKRDGLAYVTTGYRLDVPLGGLIQDPARRHLIRLIVLRLAINKINRSKHLTDAARDLVRNKPDVQCVEPAGSEIPVARDFAGEGLFCYRMPCVE